MRPSTITDPVFGYDPFNELETHPFKEDVVDMTTIDNLPNELPRDASQAFGEMFIQHVLPEMLKDESFILNKATVAQSGDLGIEFEYLRNYLEGIE